MFSEIKAFVSTLTDWIILLLVFTFFFFTCNVETITVLDKVTLLPVPSTPSFAAEVFTMLVSDLAPVGVPIVVTSPTAAFIIQVKLAFLMALIFTFPVFLLRLVRYLAPALHRHELRLVYIMLAPLSLLFALGVAFSYVFIIPPTLSFLYAYTIPINSIALLTANEFIGVIMSLLIMAGFAFTIPVFMTALTALRVISASFWLQNTRYALVFFLILSAIITPDGSGVSMLLLSVPVSLLYGGGALVCLRLERVGKKHESELRVS